jgi:hypothetical protein
MNAESNPLTAETSPMKIVKPDVATARIAWTTVRTLLLCGAVLLASPTKGHAYADPGTGAFVYQAAYAAFLGGTFYLRRVLDLFFKRRK